MVLNPGYEETWTVFDGYDYHGERCRKRSDILCLSTGLVRNVM